MDPYPSKDRPVVPADATHARGGPRIPVPGIGKRGPETSDDEGADFVRQVDGMVTKDGLDRMLMNPDEFKNAPPWAISLMNQVRVMNIEIASIAFAFQRRGLITTEELNEARATINSAAEKEFQSMVHKLGRQLSRRPGSPPEPVNPQDPRRPAIP